MLTSYPLLGFWLFSSSALAHSLQRRDLNSCLSSAGLQPITNTSSAYAGDVSAYNLRFYPDPTAILYPTNSEQVAAAVSCAASLGFSGVSVKGGGHSYAACGLGGNGALVLDLSNLNSVVVNADGTAVIGGGAKLGNIILGLSEQGRAMPSGNCPYVGIGGHAGFGGWGFMSRMWGLSLDAVFAYDVVLANGTLLTNVTSASAPDLFWALNGAAPNFGVITNYHVKTFAMPTAVIDYSFTFNAGVLTTAQATSLFLAFQSFVLTDLPAALGPGITLGANNYFQVGGVYYGGDLSTFTALYAPLVSQMPPGYVLVTAVDSWIASANLASGGVSLNTTGVPNTHDTFFAKSLVTPSDVLLSTDAVTAFFTYLSSTQTDTNWFIECNLWGGKNSYLNTVSTAASSFAHRNSLLVWQFYASSTTPGTYTPNQIAFVQGMYDALVNPMLSAWGSTYGAYTNYIDPTLSTSQSESLYWGNQFSRLSTLRGVYDPNQVFLNSQSILASTSPATNTSSTSLSPSGSSGSASSTTGSSPVSNPKVSATTSASVNASVTPTPKAAGVANAIQLSLGLVIASFFCLFV